MRFLVIFNLPGVMPRQTASVEGTEVGYPTTEATKAEKITKFFTPMVFSSILLKKLKSGKINPPSKY